MSEEKCCTTATDLKVDQNYWENQYQEKNTGWDLGQIAPPLKQYFDSLIDKNIRILIPGCGNSYEAQYLLNQGFTNITIIDIAPTLIKNLKNKFSDNPNIQIILGDFFEHQGIYDYIFEQTFFCALQPILRQKYVLKMHQLLSDNGKLAGLLFNRKFEKSPPFGGSLNEYIQLFQNVFFLNTITLAENSVPARENTELFFEFTKKNEAIV